MVRIKEKEQFMKTKEWKEWYSSRPEVIKDLIDKIPPDRLYRLKDSSRCYCTIYSWSEDGTVTVLIEFKYNRVFMERRVFGITPELLEEAEKFPDPSECGDPCPGISQEDRLEIAREVIRKKKEGL